MWIKRIAVHTHTRQQKHPIDSVHRPRFTRGFQKKKLEQLLHNRVVIIKLISGAAMSFISMSSFLFNWNWAAPYNSMCVLTDRLALLLWFYGLILPENHFHILSYVFTLWSQLSVSSKICSSSENPPIFGLSPPEFSSCLTKPTSLFTPRHPPHTLLTCNWHAFIS